MANRPATQIDLTETLVRDLLRTQHPDMADLHLEVLARGWDNTNFRLGDDHLVRLPHRPEAAELVVNEQRWLPEIAQRLDISISVPTHTGVPDDSYPWHWSITPWFSGEVAAVAETNSQSNAVVLGTFLHQLHVPAPENAPENPYRGRPLALRAKSFEENVNAVRGADRTALAQVFAEALRVPPSQQRVWLHGDLHGRNMIVRDDQLSAVIDWGDICAGDPATDLAAAFMIVPDHLQLVQELAGASPNDWARARGWAAHFAAVYVQFSDDDEVLANMGRNLIDTLLNPKGP